ncbi:MAG: hypothetical protein IJS52_03350 [Bacilli bacterium]|nr:hypothetical protein [Bacilli bacterium]
MKKHSLLTLATLPLILSACGGTSSQGSSVTPSSEASSSSSEPSASSERKVDGLVTKEVNVKMVSHFGEKFAEEEIADTCTYSDYWFLEDSSKLNYGLALMSAFTAGASYTNSIDETGTKIEALMKQMGFTSIKKNKYYEQFATFADSIGVIIGQKSIKDYEGKPYTLLALFPRNAGYVNEWVGNFNLGEEGIHEGFRQTRDEALRFLKKYVTESNLTGDLKLWATGYSRGAATVNLLGGYLGENVGYLGENVKLAPKDMFVYTVGTPRVIPSGLQKAATLNVEGPRGGDYALDTDIPAYTYSGAATGVLDLQADQYKGIHNFTAIGDYITKLPPKEWAFDRFGQSEEFLYGEEAMLNELRKYSPETADSFAGGKTYATQTSNKTFDPSSFSLIDTNEKQSANEMIDERINALFKVIPTRKAYVEGGYDVALGALAGVFGTDVDGFLGCVKDNIGTAVKAGLLNVIAHVMDETGKTESEATALILASLFQKEGKAEEYTDQQFLADFLDFFVNDYQADLRSSLRCSLLASLIPAPYGPFYLDVLNHAKELKFKAKTADDLLYLIGDHIATHREDPIVNAVADALVKLIPAESATYISILAGATGKNYDDKELYPDDLTKNKAIILDFLAVCSTGVPNPEKEGEIATKPELIRYSVLGMIVPMVLSMGLGVDAPNLRNLLVNGCNDGENPTVSDPVLLSVLADEILSIALPKDEETSERVDFVKAADQSLLDLLEKGRTEKNAQHVENIKEHIGAVRKVLLTLLLNPGESFDLMKEVGNAITFIDKVQFLFPAHDHELYIAYLRSKIVA